MAKPTSDAEGLQPPTVRPEVSKGPPAVPPLAAATERIRREHPDLPAEAADLLARAEHARRSGLFPAARQALADLSSALDKHPLVRHGRIVLLLATEEYEQALAALEVEANRLPAQRRAARDTDQPAADAANVEPLDEAWVWYSIAAACEHLGRRAQEIRAVVRALEIRPEETPARRLFEVQRDQGDFAGALDTVLLLRRLRDTHELAIAQVRLLTRLDRADEAHALAETLIAIDPPLPAALESWATVLLSLPRGAERVAERMADERARRGDHPAFLVGHGRALHRMERTAEAAALLEQAGQTAPANRALWYDLAVMQRQIGRLADSQASFERALALDELDPSALRVHGVEHRYHYGDAAWIRVGRALARLERYPKERQVELHYAAAKACEDVGELDAAFEHYRAGGAKQQQLTPYRHAAAVGLMRTLRQGMHRQTYAAFAPPRCPSAKPVFVLGMPRSGTTLVEQILAAHPQAHGAGELKLLHRVLDGIAVNGAMIRTREDRGAFDTYVPGVDLDCTDASFAERGERYVAVVSALAAAAGRGDALRVVDKMPGNYTWTGMIPLILPNARIVHTRRHPMDCCLSNYRIFFPDGMPWSYDLRTLGKCWRAYHEHMQHWETRLPPGMLLSVHYEAVVADVATMARRIVEHVGLPWDDGCLRFYDGARPVKTASLAQVRQPVYGNAVGRWRRYEGFLKPLLDELGPLVRAYEDDLNAALARLAPPEAAAAQPAGRSPRTSTASRSM